MKVLRNDAEEAKGKLARRDADLKGLERKLEARERELSDLRMDHDRYKVTCCIVQLTRRRPLRIVDNKVTPRC